jgi:hypothetical protein
MALTSTLEMAAEQHGFRPPIAAEGIPRKRRSPQLEFIEDELMPWLLFRSLRAEYRLTSTREFVRAVAATPAFKRAPKAAREHFGWILGRYARPSTCFCIVKTHRAIAKDLGVSEKTIARTFSAMEATGLTDSRQRYAHHTPSFRHPVGKVTWIRPEAFNESSALSFGSSVSPIGVSSIDESSSTKNLSRETSLQDRQTEQRETGPKEQITKLVTTASLTGPLDRGLTAAIRPGRCPNSPFHVAGRTCPRCGRVGEWRD